MDSGRGTSGPDDVSFGERLCDDMCHHLAVEVLLEAPSVLLPVRPQHMGSSGRGDGSGEGKPKESRDGCERLQDVLDLELAGLRISIDPDANAAEDASPIFLPILKRLAQLPNFLAKVLRKAHAPVSSAAG